VTAIKGRKDKRALAASRKVANIQFTGSFLSAVDGFIS
jgi:hypothetical protein